MLGYGNCLNCGLLTALDDTKGKTWRCGWCGKTYNQVLDSQPAQPRSTIGEVLGKVRHELVSLCGLIAFDSENFAPERAIHIDTNDSIHAIDELLKNLDQTKLQTVIGLPKPRTREDLHD